MCVVRGVFVCVNGDDVRCVLRERAALSIALSTLVMYVALLLLLLFFIMSNALAFMHCLIITVIIFPSFFSFLLLFLIILFFLWPVLGVPRRLFAPGPLGPMALIMFRGGALLLPLTDSRIHILRHPLLTLPWRSMAL